MQPKPIIWLLLLQVSFVAHSQSLSQEASRQRAIEALQQMVPTASLAQVSTSAARRARGVEAAYYVFPLEGADNGYVIASADERAHPLLAYIPEGSFCSDSIPPAMQLWLRLYEQDLDWADTHSSLFTLNSSLTNSRSDVDYLVQAQWSQGSPYYNQCVFSNSYCYTGCVATAMAQIMYYWGTTGGYPHGCTALDAYTTSSYGYSVGALEAIDAFDWTNMQPTYSSASTSTQTSAVAQLMRYCGQAVEMDYTTSGSGATSSDVTPALKNYFGYEATAHYISRATMTAAAWDSIVYEEVAAGRPVYMAGVDGEELVGHAFVCDGYQQTTDLYHFNWGWSGLCNGYFALEALTPGGTGTGGTTSDYGDYSLMRDAIVGIQPPTGETHETQAYDLLTAEGVYLTSATSHSRESRTDNASDISLLSVILNNTGETVNLDYDYGLLTDDGRVVCNFGMGGSASVLPSYGYYFTAPLSLGAQLPYGSYLLAPVGRVTGETEWMAMQGADHNYIRVIVEEQTITLEPSFDIETDMLSTSNEEGTFDNILCLTNNGAEELSTSFALIVDGAVSQYLESYIAPGESDSIALTYTGAVDNNVILSDIYSAAYPYIADTTYAYIEWDMEWTGYIDAAYRLYADTYDAVLYLSNRADYAYIHDVVLQLFPYGGSTSQALTCTLSVSLPPRTAAAFPFSFENIETGTTYDLGVSLYEGNTTSTTLLSYYGCTLTPTRGTIIVTPTGTTYTPDTKTVSVPEDAYFVDLRFSDNAAALTPGDGASTLYILAEGSPRPAALLGKNIVIGSAASSLSFVLEDGFDTPVDFTATSATCTRTFTEASVYEPLVLPFAADIPSGLTVETLTASSADTLYFSPVASIEPFTPYLACPSSAGTYTFTASNAYIPADTLSLSRLGQYDLIATLTPDTIPLAYALSDDASTFTFTGQDVCVAPACVYLINYTTPSEDTPLVIAHLTADPSAILGPQAEATTADPRTFSLSGVCVGTDNTLLPPGIYLRGGKKILIR